MNNSDARTEAGSSSARTLESLANKLLAHHQSIGKSERTLQDLRYYLIAFIQWLGNTFAVFTADCLRRSHLESYQHVLANKTNRNGLLLKPGSLNNHIWAVKLFVRYLWEQGYITADLSRHIQSVKEPEMLPTSVLTHSQVKRLLKSVDTTTKEGYRDRTILELCYSCGLRSGEVNGLTVDDVDLANSQLKVLGKGSKERMVPVGKTALCCLETYLKAIRPFFNGSRQYRALFFNKFGRPYSKTVLQTMVRKYAGRLDFNVHVTPHTFRRSCTTEMIRANANLYHVKDMLGHKTLRTLKAYTKLTILDLKKPHARCHPRERDLV